MRLKLYHIKYVILFFLITFLVGIQKLFLAKFSLSILEDATFWQDTLTTSSAYYFTIIFIVFWIAEKEVKTNPDILNNENIIKQFIIADLDSSFYEFNDKENLRNKTEEWKYHVKTKIGKLDEKATPLDRKAWREQDETNDYVVKRKQLLDTISDEYIADNIHFLKVDYEHVDESTIINGFTPKRNKKFKKENALWKITKDVAPKFIMSILYTLVLRSFTLRFNEFNWVVVQELAVQLIGLTMTVVFAIQYAPQFVQEHIIAPLNNRVLHIKRYLSEKRK